MTNEEFQRLVLSKFDQMDKRFTQIDQRFDQMETQISENTQIIKALMHRTEELDAKYDGLLNTTASKDSIAALDTKLDRIATDVTSMARKILDHDDDIRELRRAK